MRLISYISRGQHNPETGISAFPSSEFFLHASVVSLQDLELASLNRGANLAKVVQHELSRWVEQTAIALVVRWMMENREKLHLLAVKE